MSSPLPKLKEHPARWARSLRCPERRRHRHLPHRSHAGARAGTAVHPSATRAASADFFSRDRTRPERRRLQTLRTAANQVSCARTP
eukprot:4532257-Prymnesium_polylepis.1